MFSYLYNAYVKKISRFIYATHYIFLQPAMKTQRPLLSIRIIEDIMGSDDKINNVLNFERFENAFAFYIKKILCHIQCKLAKLCKPQNY